MGREATCRVQWGEASGEAKVLLETHELLVRGGGTLPARRVPLTSLEQIEVRGEWLCFLAGAEAVTLGLGAQQAKSWAKKLTAPPPTLAAKLGITSATNLGLIGNIDAEELIGAIGIAASTESRSPDLMLAMVKSAADLAYAMDCCAAYRTRSPIWIVYPKGAGRPIGETEIRETMRRAGWMDTKIASVSAVLTALRFNLRA